MHKFGQPYFIPRYALAKLLPAGKDCVHFAPILAISPFLAHFFTIFASQRPWIGRKTKKNLLKVGIIFLICGPNRWN